jgi:hypothetical protein
MAVATVSPGVGGVGEGREADSSSPPQAERTARHRIPRKALLQVYDMMDLPWKRTVRDSSTEKRGPGSSGCIKALYLKNEEASGE